VPFAASAEELRPAHEAAYGPGHPDRSVEVGQGLAPLLEGGVVGPVMPCSRMAVVGGEPVGAAIVCDAPAEPPFGGPWLAELFRAPDERGVGALLLDATLWQAAADGLRSIGLAVTEGNGARGLYEDAGFSLVLSAYTVRIPG
jgi:GNAT superfamily N-acetyltransferase